MSQVHSRSSTCVAAPHYMIMCFAHMLQGGHYLDIATVSAAERLGDSVDDTPGQLAGLHPGGQLGRIPTCILGTIVSMVSRVPSSCRCNGGTPCHATANVLMHLLMSLPPSLYGPLLLPCRVRVLACDMYTALNCSYVSTCVGLSTLQACMVMDQHS
jgi:hypothetical protein